MAFRWSLDFDEDIFGLDHSKRDRTSSFNLREWTAGSINNQSQSTLVKALPAEIRPLIWKHIVGGKVIHPTHSDTGKWKYPVCINDRSPKELYDLSRQPDDEFVDMEGYEANRDCCKNKTLLQKQEIMKKIRSAAFGHHECRGDKDEDKVENAYLRRTDDDFLKDLRVLLTCKLVHDEVLLAFWETNTFSLLDRWDWVFFFDGVLSLERKLIKSVELSLHTGQLLSEIPVPNRLNLKSLKNLHISLQDSRDGALHFRQLADVKTAISKLMGDTNLQSARISVAIDNADHSHCKCDIVWTHNYWRMPALSQEDCIDIADTISYSLEYGSLLENKPMSEVLLGCPESARNTKLPETPDKSMYFCNIASSAIQCQAVHADMLVKRFGKDTSKTAEPCGAEHQCLICRDREGIVLLYGASGHCGKPGECNELGGYCNPKVMPVEYF